MKEEMTPRERVEAVLLGRGADHVPFTVYAGMIPQCQTERRLRNEGVCIVRGFGVFETQAPDVTERTCHYHENGQLCLRTDIETPCGSLFSIGKSVEMNAPGGATTWQVQKLFKGPEDYKALEFMIRNRRYVADYGPFARAQELDGGDAIFRAGVAYEPLQEIIIRLMGLETFCIEWAERRDEVLNLYEALREDRRKIYPIVAESPALSANYGGNVTPDVIGPGLFEKYLMPDYEEFSEIMHKHNKLAGTHLDGNNKIVSSIVSRSSLDYIEAFTPPPDCDLSVKEALDAWPDKVLWINFPSSVHLQDAEGIEAATLDILEQSKPGDRLIVGITEDVPEHRWRESFSVIAGTLNGYGRLPITWERTPQEIET